MTKKDKKIVGLIHAILDVDVKERTEEQKDFLNSIKENVSFDKQSLQNNKKLFANLDLSRHYIRLELDPIDWDLDNNGQPKEEGIPITDVDRLIAKLTTIKVKDTEKDIETKDMYEAIKIRMIKLDDEWDDEDESENKIKSIKLDGEWDEDEPKNDQQNQNA